MSEKNTSAIKSWLRFFRIVNLPTVPGDVLVGAGALCAVAPAARLPASSLREIAVACVASCFLYLFGLADNDIVGAKSDGDERPISAGEISIGAARLARGLCLAAVMIAGAAANLPPMWWFASLALAISVVVYNRTRLCVLMGLCRGLNVVCGAMVMWSRFSLPIEKSVAVLGFLCLIWTAYIAIVTRISKNEAHDQSKRAFVGLLIGSLVYLQLFALVVEALLCPATNRLLIVGAILLVALRLLRRFLPDVSAS